MKQSKISVVIPTRQENDESYLLKISALYPKHQKIEYIVVDTGTSTSLLDLIKRRDFSILQTELQTRAERLQRGFDLAQGDLIVFHHPRSLLPNTVFNYLIENGHRLRWGGFTQSFDRKGLGLNFTSWYSNNVRSRLWKIVYLDHCLFFKKELLNLKIPPIPIFEDTEISHILGRSGPPEILPFKSETSSIRFEKNGFWKQGLKNQSLKLAYLLGGSPEKLNEFYEKKLNLN